MNRLKGVCVGAGYFSHFQYEAWGRIPEVEILAGCDTDAGRLKNVQEKFRLPRAYAGFREMFDREKPDFVDIITPPATHREICAEAAARGIHILCQKPLAPGFEEAQAIVGDARQRGVRFMVHENFRFQPWYRAIKRELEAGTIGLLHSIAFRCRMGDGWGENAYIPRQPYFREYPRFLVFESGIHFIDTFRFLAGEIRRVSAWLRRLNPVIKGEDCALVVFDFAGGAVGQWDANRYNEADCRDPRYTFGEMLVEGSAGSLRLGRDGKVTLKRLGQAPQPVVFHHRPHGFCADSCYFAQRHFVECLLNGMPFETDGREYLKNLAVQEAVYRAAATGMPCELS